MALVWIGILATSLWAAFEAKGFGYRKQDIKGMAAIGPVGWFFACMLLWIIAFPLYLASREKLRAAGLAAKNVVSA